MSQQNRIQLLAWLVLLVITASCKNNDAPTPDDKPEPVPDSEVITIPVVVHVVNYAPAPFELSDEKIHSQFVVLNEDFRAKNTGLSQVPDEFKDRIADVGIEFKLATVDPHGLPTTGILRNSSDVTGFDGKDITGQVPIEDLKLFFTAQGGQDAWPRDQYLNIWVADLSDRHGNLGLGGYAQFPDADPRIDGVVIDPRVFGTVAPLETNFDLGRTATHEIGHWLHLYHIYGEDENCENGDLVDDTPTQYAQYANTPSHPQSSCGSNDMFMNFMDRVYDGSMHMFSKGQKKRMRANFDPDGLRRQLYLNSK